MPGVRGRRAPRRRRPTRLRPRKESRAHRAHELAATAASAARPARHPAEPGQRPARGVGGWSAPGAAPTPPPEPPARSIPFPSSDYAIITTAAPRRSPGTRGRRTGVAPTAPRRSARPAAANLPDKAVLLRLFEQMVLLRRFETVGADGLPQRRDPGLPPPLHRRGSRRRSASAPISRRDDWITSTHRGHGHALAKGIDPRALMAELFGKARRRLRRARRHHAPLRPLGRPVRHQRHRRRRHRPGRRRRPRRQRSAGRGGVGVAFFGDGASNHGAFHEALNFAAVQTRARRLRLREQPLRHRDAARAWRRSTPTSPPGAPPTACPASPSTATTCSRSGAAMREAIERARAGGGPTLIEAKTYRTVGHHEGDPVVGTYRTQEEVDALGAARPASTCSAAASSTNSRSRHRGRARRDRGADRGSRRGRRSTSPAASPEPDPATRARHVYADPINPPEALAPPPAGARPRAGLARCGSRRHRRGDARATRTSSTSAKAPASAAAASPTPRGSGRSSARSGWSTRPISEQGFTGAAVGASATGARAVADLMFADFLSRPPARSSSRRRSCAT